ncbi:unnamed protein product [Orchesella dallaii]|uniref:Uncharacterized protein n=1 Tax=Orchesella dallaii TaxID=48710 RepID=A0ABP1PW03_9HEXA
MAMTTLTIEDVEARWVKENRRVSPRPLFKALWNFCRSEPSSKWRKLFTSKRAAMKIVVSFYCENGLVWEKYTRKELPLEKVGAYLTAIFHNRRSRKSCSLIASLMLKFYDVLYPNSRMTTSLEILGKHGSRAAKRFQSTSKRCLELDVTDFNKD